MFEEYYEFNENSKYTIILIPVSDFICKLYNKKGCNFNSLKISDELIKVATTGIFDKPEQSIMELLVNSIDSYNEINSIGKFGIGFYSIIFWISRPLNGEYPRFINLESTYLNRIGELKSYGIILKWSNKGLLFEKYDITNPTITGTIITIDCTNFQLNDNIITTMSEQINRLKYIEGGEIYQNDVKLNKITKSENKVYIYLNKNKIEVIDFAKGINEYVLEKSLLIPFLSTKEKHISNFVKNPFLLKNEDKQKCTFNIIINGIVIVKVDIKVEYDSKYNYCIYLPNTSKLSISKNDILYEKESFELKVFEIQIYKLINLILDYEKNISNIFTLLETYSKKNNQIYNCINTIKTNILNTKDIIIIPHTWDNIIISLLPYETFIKYNNTELFDIENKIYDKLIKISNSNIFKYINVIFVNLNDKLFDTYGLMNFIFINSEISNNIEKVINSVDDLLLIPNTLNEYNIFIKNEYNIFILYSKICNFTFVKKFSNIKIIGLKREQFIDTIINYVSSIIKDDEIKLKFIQKLNTKISYLKYEFVYGSELKVHINKFLPQSYTINKYKLLYPNLNNIYLFIKDLEKEIIILELKYKYDTFFRNYYNNAYELKYNYNGMDDMLFNFKKFIYDEFEKDKILLYSIIDSIWNKYYYNMKTITFKIPKKSNVEKLNILLNTITTKLFYYYIEISYEFKNNSLGIPDIKLFDYSNLELEYISQDLINEMYIGLMECIFNEEYYVFLGIIIKFINIYGYKRDNVNGLGLFLLNEIRRLAPINILQPIISNLLLVGRLYTYDNRILLPIFSSVEKYYNMSNRENNVDKLFF